MGNKTPRAFVPPRIPPTTSSVASFPNEDIRKHYKFGQTLESTADFELRKCIHRKTGVIRQVKIIKQGRLPNLSLIHPGLL